MNPAPGQRQRGQDGRLCGDGSVRKCITLRPDVAFAVQLWADEFCSGNLSYAIDTLVLYGLKAEGFPISGIKERPVATRKFHTKA